jgi:cathepsin L
MYGTVEEFAVRKELYAALSEEIDAINSNPASTHVAGHNKFSDWTPLEKEHLLGLKNMPMPAFDEAEVVEDVEFNVANDIDWRSQGKVGPVRDQGQCGSCWAFAAIGTIEPSWAIKTGNLIDMSEQELVDCSSSAGNMGCNGGNAAWAYDWLKTKKTMTESDYPYVARKGTCRYNSTKGINNVSGWTWP